MFIASKYEEVLSPHVANFSHVADDTFSDKEILDAERHILAVLNYDLSYPNPMNFLRRISKPDNYDVRTRTLAKYLMEISLVDHRFMKYRQSHIAAASIFLARVIYERGPWVCHSISPSFHLCLSNLYLRMQLLLIILVIPKKRSCLCMSCLLITSADHLSMKHSSRNMPARDSSKVHHHQSISLS